MSLDLSEYVDKYIPLEKERLTVEELVAYLTSEGYEVTKITDTSRNKLVYVNDKYHVTVRGFVKMVGRNKEKLSAWEKERKQLQVRKGVNIDNEIFEEFSKVTGGIPFGTWVKKKMLEEIYGDWQSKLVPPQQYELVDDMVLVDDGERISLCHISEFATRDFKLWSAIPPRSIAPKKKEVNKKLTIKKKEDSLQIKSQ